MTPPFLPDLTDLHFCVVNPPPGPDAPIYAEFELSANEKITGAKLFQDTTELGDLEWAFPAQTGDRTEYWRTPGNAFAWAWTTSYRVEASATRDKSSVVEVTAVAAITQAARSKSGRYSPGAAEKVTLLASGDVETLVFAFNASSEKIVITTIHLPTGFAVNPFNLSLWEDDLTNGFQNTGASFSSPQNVGNDRISYRATYNWTVGFTYQLRAKVTQTLSPLVFSEDSPVDYNNGDTMPTP